MSPAPAPRFSVVVPSFNEERFLPPLLDSIEAARAAYSRGPGAIEVVVADNASTDGTAAVAAARGCRVVRIEKRAIAAARNGGARAARGEFLAFVDADTRIHAGTFDAIDRAFARGGAVAAATGVTMERWSPGIALTYALFLPMVWLTGMDTGVVCCRREDFEAVGGYDENLLLAEDVRFLLALRRLGRRRGARLVRAKNAKAVASARKFDDHGDWHYFRIFLRVLLTGGWRRREVTRLAEAYWYRPMR